MSFRMLVGMVLAAGCFDPNVKNGGYTCNPIDVPACPLGFFCFQGRCLDAVTVDAGPPREGHDLAVGDVSGDLAVRREVIHDLAVAKVDLAGVVQDMTMVPDMTMMPVAHDMAKPHHDMAHAPGHDMAQGMCWHAGVPCTNNSQCCSNTCDPAQGNICIGG
jgi:hypothetical protein